MVLEVQEHNEIDYQDDGCKHYDDYDAYFPAENFRIFALLSHQEFFPLLLRLLATAHNLLAGHNVKTINIMIWFS
jgi:hypothetical protein